MAIRLGIQCRLYRNTGTYQNPVWNEIRAVRDVTLNLQTAKADVTSRANNGWRANVATLREASIETQLLWDPSEDDFTVLLNAYLNNTTIEILALDGPVTQTGSQGLRAECSVTAFSRSEALEEAVTAAVTLEPTYGANPPTWYITS
jgi:hypothetical protein